MTARNCIQRLTTRILVAEYPNTTQRWWEAHRSELVEAGALNQRGKAYFGRLIDIDNWLRGKTDACTGSEAATNG